MEVKVSLPVDVLEIMKQFGTPSEVTDRILAAGEEWYFDMENCPAYETSCRNVRIPITVTNQYYEELVFTRGEHSNKVSLRRIISYFIYNELYNELGWEPVDSTSETNEMCSEIKKLINRVAMLRSRLKREGYSEGVLECNDICKSLERLYDYAKRNQ